MTKFLKNLISVVLITILIISLILINPPKSQASAVFSCNWDNGTDEKNTGAGGVGPGNSVWNYMDNANNVLSRDTAITWNNSLTSLKYSGTQGGYVRYSVPQTAYGARFAFYVDAENLSNNQTAPFVESQNESGNLSSFLSLINKNGSLYIRVNANGGLVGNDAPINLQTWYQIEFKWSRNTVGGFAWRVWDAMGTSLIQDEQVLLGTTADKATGYIYAGLTWFTSGGDVTYHIDNFVVDDSFNYPGPDTGIGYIPNVVLSVSKIVVKTNESINFTYLNIGGAPTSCFWNFGDGQTSNICGSVSHSYQAEGNYDVTLNASNAAGSDLKTISVKVDNVLAFTYLSDDFESGQFRVGSLNKQPIWYWPDNDSTNGQNAYWKLTNADSHSGNYSIRLDYLARNGFSNVCGGTTIYQRRSYDGTNYFVADNGANLAQRPYFNNNCGNNCATSCSFADGGTRYLYDITKNYTRWEVTGPQNQEAINDRLNLTNIVPGPGYDKAATISVGDQCYFTHACGIDGNVCINSGCPSSCVSRRSDSDSQRITLGGVSAQEYGTAVYRRFYFKFSSDYTWADATQKIGYWGVVGDYSYGASCLTLDGHNAFDAGNQLGWKRYSGSPFPIKLGVWYYFEEMMKSKSSVESNDGEYKMWIVEDGQDPGEPKLDLKNLNAPPTTSGISVWANKQTSSDMTGYVYIDDAIISSQRIGTVSYSRDASICAESNWTFSLGTCSSGVQIKTWTKQGACSGGVDYCSGRTSCTETLSCAVINKYKLSDIGNLIAKWHTNDTTYDLNHDNTVDSKDLALMMKNFSL